MDFAQLDYLYYDQGFNIIPIIFKYKQPSIFWKEWQEKEIPKETFERWKKKEFVGNNFAIITGKIYRGPHTGKYLVCIDIDNKLGIDEFLSYFGETNSLEELAQKTIVVQHEDAKDEKAHVYFIAEKPISKRGRITGYDKDNKTISLIEVKSDSSTYVVCPPSIYETGYQYQIKGTNQIQVLNQEKCEKLEYALDTIYQSYSYNYYNQTTGKTSFLTEELKRMTRKLDIDSVKHKIPNGARNNTLLAIADSLIANHFPKSREFLKIILFEINEKLCDEPLEEKELESIWTQATNYIKNSNKEKKLAKNYDASRSDNSQTRGDSKNKKEFTVFKYTLDNKIFESAIISGKQFFMTVDDKGEVILIEKIEQETRILKPPYIEEYPSKPYVFENKEEMEKFVKMVKEKGISIDSFFWKIKEFVSKFIVHHSHILDYISSLILFSRQVLYNTLYHVCFRWW
jgi:bifunctional DNA primase/polymerase-like protein/primase-like protein